MDIKIEKKQPWVRYKYYILVGVSIMVIILYLLLSNSGSAQLHYDRCNLLITEAQQDKFYDYLEVEGIVQPKLTVKLNSLEDGIVERIVAEEGSILSAGDTILILNNPDLLRVIEDEKDELQKQHFTYKEKQLLIDRKTSELKRQSLKTLYELARLEKQHNLDREEYQIGIKSKAQLEVASDEYNFNQQNSEMLIRELKQDSLMNQIQINLMANDLKREETKFQRSESRKNGLIIRTPINGQLGFINVIQGEKVLAGSNIGELKVVDQYKINTKISEYYIDKVSIGLPATIVFQDTKYELKITKVNPEIKDRQFEVDLVFVDKQPESIRIGKNYRIQIELGQPEDALIIDKGSFYQETGGQWIFRLDKSGNKATKVNVVIGRQNPRSYEIINGLRPGDKVVISGYENFRDIQELILK